MSLDITEIQMKTTMQMRYYYSPIRKLKFKKNFRGFPGGTGVENPPANAGDTGSIPGLGRYHMPRSN